MDDRSEAYFSDSLMDKDFNRLSDFIHDRIGIKMPLPKKGMVESRLRKRLRNLNIMTYRDYCEYLLSPEGEMHELEYFINAITTNKTEFFREPNHFNYLVKTALPELILDHGAGLGKTMTVWSAGCSTGEEPYTLAMVLAEFSERYPGFSFDYVILATDISTDVLEKAKIGIYDVDLDEPIPEHMKKKYLLKSKDQGARLIRIIPELRSRIRFRQLNFMDEKFMFREPMDIIFCRNVIIYFDRIVQKNILQKICRYLKHGGYLFVGHSETLNNLDLPLVMVAPTIYRKMK